VFNAEKRCPESDIGEPPWIFLSACTASTSSMGGYPVLRAPALRGRILGRGIVSCFIAQAEDEERHDPGVLSHLFDKAVTFSTERRHFSDTFVSSPHWMRCEGRLFPREAAAPATWAETTGTLERNTEALKEVAAGMKERRGTAHKLHEGRIESSRTWETGKSPLALRREPCFPAR